MTMHFVIKPGRKDLPFKSLMAALSGHLATADGLVRIEPVTAQKQRSLP
ncbi:MULTISPECIES: hypothetical protein [unclassified Minwuia]|nr:MULTISPECIES: hypothetical protein [unclassified Minwuia]